MINGHTACHIHLLYVERNDPEDFIPHLVAWWHREHKFDQKCISSTS
jgi:hypothetical protein